MIKFHCEQCGQKIGVDDTTTGRAVRCPRCKSACNVPERVHPAEPITVANTYEAVVDVGSAYTAEPDLSISPTMVSNQAPSPRSDSEVVCGSCGLQMQLTHDLMGKTLSCPTCGWQFVAGGHVPQAPSHIPDPLAALIPTANASHNPEASVPSASSSLIQHARQAGTGSRKTAWLLAGGIGGLVILAIIVGLFVFGNGLRGLFGGKDNWDAVLDEYEKIVDQTIKIQKKVEAGDTNVLTEMTSLSKKYQDLNEKLAKAKDRQMTEAQVKRFVAICEKYAKEIGGGRNSGGNIGYSGTTTNNRRVTMAELQTKIKTVSKASAGGYDLDNWNKIIGEPDETRGDLDWPRWVYKCSDGILILTIVNDFLQKADAVVILQQEAKPN